MNAHPPSAPPKQTQYRTLSLDPESIRADNKARTVEASLSSEQPVSREFGNEVLSHDPSAVNLTRVKQGLPLLLHHDPTQQVGVVENIRLQGKRLLGTLRFGTSAKAREAFEEVREGIFRNLSIGYVIDDLKRTAEDVYTATKWTLLETSIVSIPADNTVGIGRASTAMNTRTQEASMPDTPEKSDTFKPEGSVSKERKRVGDILDYGKRFGFEEEAQTAIRQGTSFASFREWVLENKERDTPPVPYPSHLGMSRSEAERFSIRKLILAQATNDWSDAGLEREAIRATGPGKHGGVILPQDVLYAPSTRADITTSTDGGLIGTDHRADLFVDYLRKRLVVANLGATYLDGLQGDVSIPRQTGSATVGWVTEGNPLSESELSTDTITLSPKTCGAYSDFTRRMLLQSSPAIEDLVKRDLANSVAAEIDRVALVGDGTSNSPTGVLPSVSGSYNVSLTSNTLDWPAIVAMESTVAGNDADRDTLAYVVNSATRGKLKVTRKGDGTNDVDDFILDDSVLDPRGFARLNGYPVAVTNHMPSNYNPGGNKSALLFGDFSSLVIGTWATTELAVDPYALFTSGGIRVRVFTDLDIALRNAQSFATIIDASTA